MASLRRLPPIILVRAMSAPFSGLMMLPWAFASVFGPSLFAYLRQINGNYNQALTFLAGLMTAALILPILVRPPRKQTERKKRKPKGPLDPEEVCRLVASSTGIRLFGLYVGRAKIKLRRLKPTLKKLQKPDCACAIG